jgi:ankyrin repeat protein
LGVVVYFVNGLRFGKVKGISIKILSNIYEINTCDNSGKTAIIHAIQRNDDTLTNDLLKKGVSIMNGHSIINWANENGASEFILKKLQKLLEKKIFK